MRYAIVIEPAEGKSPRYMSLLHLPGCVATGTSIEEAAGEIVIEFHSSTGPSHNLA